MTVMLPAPPFSRIAPTTMSAKPSESTSPASTTAPNSSPGSSRPGTDGVSCVIVIGVRRGPRRLPSHSRTSPGETGKPVAACACAESPWTMSA
jgi:hypothetical protein